MQVNNFKFFLEFCKFFVTNSGFEGFFLILINDSSPRNRSHFLSKKVLSSLHSSTPLLAMLIHFIQKLLLFFGLPAYKFCDLN